MHIKMSNILFSLISGLTVMVGACDRNGSSVTAIENNDSIPSVVKQLVRAVSDNDSDGFARLVSYPLQRPYPLRDIENVEQMTKYYKVMVDDSLRNLLTTAGPERWSEYGWRGWSLDDGRYIWADDNVYSVEYLSAAEREQLEKLANDELGSIDPSMRLGWRPLTCLRNDTDGSVYRIDSRSEGDDNNERLRLAIYKRGASLKGKPSIIIEGSRQLEGSEASPVYSFVDPAKGEIRIDPAGSESANPLLSAGNDSIVELQRVYWRDLIRTSAK